MPSDYAHRVARLHLIHHHDVPEKDASKMSKNEIWRNFEENAVENYLENAVQWLEDDGIDVPV